METYVTLSSLLIAGIVLLVELIKAHYNHEKKFLNFFDKPLDNKGKWWYN